MPTEVASDNGHPAGSCSQPLVSCALSRCMVYRRHLVAGLPQVLCEAYRHDSLSASPSSVDSDGCCYIGKRSCGVNSNPYEFC
jgi:hypothetical protein